MCIRKKPKKICDLCLYHNGCLVEQYHEPDHYCPSFRRKGLYVKQTEVKHPVLCYTCRHEARCRFHYYMNCTQCAFHLEKP